MTRELQIKQKVNLINFLSKKYAGVIITASPITERENWDRLQTAIAELAVLRAELWAERRAEIEQENAKFEQVKTN
jgi:hypothetical protein